VSSIINLWFCARSHSKIIAAVVMAEKKGNKNGLTKVCGNCLASEGSASSPKLSACARCGLVLYCSRDCQREHWKANHKQHCDAKADRAPQNHKLTKPCVKVAGESVPSVWIRSPARLHAL